MRTSYKTKDILSDALSGCSEVLLADYYSRIDQAEVSVKGAHLALDMSKAMQQRILDTRSQIKKMNIIVWSSAVLMSFVAIALDLQYGRSASLFVIVMWLIYLGVQKICILPYLADQKSRYQNEYQLHASKWQAAVGNSGFAEHMEIVRAEFHGDAPEKEDAVRLAIRGFALNQALRINRNQSAI